MSPLSLRSRLRLPGLRLYRRSESFGKHCLSGRVGGVDVVKLLERAAAIPSVSGSESEVAEFFVSQLTTFCDKAFVDAAGNAVGRVGSGPLEVTFLGHIDTVSGTVSVRTENGKLYGRGTVDAKGPFCAAVAAASRLPPEVKDALTLTLIGAVEEEVPSSKGARFALSAYPKPDLLIVGEPSSSDAITLGYKGRLTARLELSKPAFHSAGDGTTAAEDLIMCWQKIRAWAEGMPTATPGPFDRVQVALGSFNTSSDGLSQKAEAVVGLRLPPSCSPEEAERGMRRALREIPEGSVLETHFSGYETAYRGPKDTPLTRAFRVAIRAVDGTPRFKVKTGTSDMNVVAPFWNVPMLAYGPGDSALDHTPNEHVGLAELERAVTVLEGVFEYLAKGSRTARTL